MHFAYKSRYLGYFALLACYILVYYLQFTQKIKLDFSSFYATGMALGEGINPYKNLTLSYLHTSQKLPANLNPPIFLWVMQPFTGLAYKYAVMAWAFVSLLFSTGGALLTAELAFTTSRLRRCKVPFIVLYFALFSTFMNTAIAQMGGVLLFFIMGGYFCYIRRYERMAGIMWGIITALKCFPGLLLLLALKQQRLRVAFYFTATAGILWLIPFLIYGKAIYLHYSHMLNYVLWYGDSWNGSLYGFLFRLFVDANDIQQSLLMIRGIYFLCGIFALLWLWNQIKTNDHIDDNHSAFSLCLVMMLLLSPFGWLYYFGILLFPLLLSWQRIFTEQSQTIHLCVLWLFSFMLLNMPLDYVMATKMTGFFRPLTLFSTYFYGLLLFLLVIRKSQDKFGDVCNAVLYSQKQHLQVPVVLSLAFGLIIPVCFYLVTLHVTPSAALPINLKF